MRTSARAIATAFAVGACFAPLGAHAFESGSTGADGAFNPTVNTTVPLPPSGIFNYTSVNIPTGVTVTFQKNTANTPVVILATGNVTVAGTINVSGAASAAVGAGGNGNVGDDGVPGAGGPGGFDGGRGGRAAASFGTAGFSEPNVAGGGAGPGGGSAGTPFAGGFCVSSRCLARGGGAGFASSPNSGTANCTGTPGPGYGTAALLPLIGGSGGGGGPGGTAFQGSGGGGGGGALLIAASGILSVTGSILANGGSPGVSAGDGLGASGGGGSGGAIRLIGTTVTGNGTISAVGGTNASSGTVHVASIYSVCGNSAAGDGSAGRIRIEAETYTRTASSTPGHSFSEPAPVFIAGTPTLRIASVAGVAAPLEPTGNADVTLPSSTPNPVTVVFETAGVPVGNTVLLTVTPAFGNKTTALTPALTGSTASATSSVSVNLPVGPSVLSAQTTYTVVAALGDLLKNFAGNERVERVTLMATLGGPSKAKLITVSGKEYEVPADVLRIAALGG